jgi:hypothetical protein
MIADRRLACIYDEPVDPPHEGCRISAESGVAIRGDSRSRSQETWTAATICAWSHSECGALTLKDEPCRRCPSFAMSMNSLIESLGFTKARFGGQGQGASEPETVSPECRNRDCLSLHY